MREKRTLCKVQNTHTGQKGETIYVYVEETAFKHRVSSSISTYYACRDILADTGRILTVMVDVLQEMRPTAKVLILTGTQKH